MQLLRSFFSGLIPVNVASFILIKKTRKSSKIKLGVEVAFKYLKNSTFVLYTLFIFIFISEERKKMLLNMFTAFK